MRILFHSNAPWSQSGYGSQTELFAPLLKHELGHDLVISSFWGLHGAKLDWNDIEVWPCNPGYGSDDIPLFAAYWGNSLGGDALDITVLTLLDVWALDPRQIAGLAAASWTPIDHHELQPKIRDYFQVSQAVPVAMSRHGVRELQDANLDPVYVPHGIDTARMRPYPKADCRSALGLPEDAFIVGMVAANQGNHPPRKAWPQALEAFARFREHHTDALLYLHTYLDPDPGAGRRNGINLNELLSYFGLEGKVIVSPEMKMRLGIGYDEMAAIYSTFDVLLQPSYGEGFGIPIVEAQACGVPVIVNDFSSMPELCGAGWKTTGEPYFNYNHGAGPGWWQSPNVASIVECLDAAYEGASGLRDQARVFAEQYDIHAVLRDYWEPALATIDERLSERREHNRESLARLVGSVPSQPIPKPNRRMRRAAGRSAT